MSTTVAQALRLCALALGGAVVLGAVRGVPSPTPPAPAVAACQAPSDVATDDILWISQERAQALVHEQGVAFVDCRSLAEFEAGHVSGSLHVEPERATSAGPLLSALAGASTVITYCDAEHQCERSFRIASMLRQAGLRDVRVLEGGMPAWIERGYPAESGACGECEGSP